MNSTLEFLSPGPNYPKRQAVAGLLTAGLYTAASTAIPELRYELTGIATAMFIAGILRLPEAIRRSSVDKNITKSEFSWMTYADFQRKTMSSTHTEDFWLGEGFLWEPSQRQLLAKFIATDCHKVFDEAMTQNIVRRYVRSHLTECCKHPYTAWLRIKGMKERISHRLGVQWIHALGQAQDLWIKASDLEGHTAIFGTTGSGKSRCMEHMVAQKILKGGTVFVVDPKGDLGLQRMMKTVSKLADREQDFVQFHLGFPEESAHLNLLATYTAPSELASRISDTIPNGGGNAQAFIDMGRAVLKTIFEGMELMNVKPSFQGIHRVFNNRDEFGIKVLESYLVLNSGEEALKELKDSTHSKKLWTALTNYYRAKLPQSVVVDDILAFVERDAIHLQTTTVTTMNLIARLASGSVGELLSIEPANPKAIVMDTRSLIEKNAVVYIGLSAMTDSERARAIGSLFLSDLAANAGERYNYQHEAKPVSVFVDEAGEIACEPFTQMLNKSRGAGFTIFLATQTIADFVRNVKNRDEVTKILANLNNFLILRTPDPDTQDFLMRRIPKTIIKETTRAHGVSTSAHALASQTGNLSEHETIQEVELIPKELLGSLPNCEFFGIVSGGNVIKGKVPLLLNNKEEFRGDM